jgi:hypothetical protein
MARSGSFQKRQKEAARKEKRQEKINRRQSRSHSHGDQSQDTEHISDENIAVEPGEEEQQPATEMDSK